MEEKTQYEVYKDTEHEVKAGVIVRHFKGNLYEVVGFATHTETDETMVVYRPLYGSLEQRKRWFVRPYKMFMEKVDKKLYPDVEQEYRLEVVEIEQV